MVKRHAYGHDGAANQDMVRNLSSQLSTENYQSNQLLPAVSEYADEKKTMFDPLPIDKRQNKTLAEDSSKDLNPGVVIEAPQTSDRQLSFAAHTGRQES